MDVISMVDMVLRESLREYFWMGKRVLPNSHESLLTTLYRFFIHFITSSTSISVGSIFHFFTHTAYTSHSLLVKDSMKFSFGAPSCGISPDWQIPTGTNHYFQLVIISEFYDGKIETGKPYIYIWYVFQISGYIPWLSPVIIPSLTR